MKKEKIKSSVCPNCNELLKNEDNYCPHCGQENHTHKLPVKHYLIDFLESTIHFDTKFFYTLKHLFIKPGTITKEYNENKRARYVPPIRFYIFTSFIFFFLLSVLPKSGSLNINFTIDATNKKNVELSKYDLKKLGEEKELTQEKIDTFLNTHGESLNWFNRVKVNFLANYYSGKITIEEVKHKMVKNISTLLFTLLPVFALYLKFFELKSRKFYTEHLVFSFHFHTTLFILLILFKIISTIGFFIPLLIGFFTGSIFYLLFSLKKVYEQNWIKTIIKTILLSSLYSFTIAIGVFITAVLTIYMNLN